MIISIILIIIVSISLGVGIGIHEAKKQYKGKEDVIKHYDDIIQLKNNTIINLDKQITKNEEFILFQNTISDELHEESKAIGEKVESLRKQYQEHKDTVNAELAEYNEAISQHKSELEEAIQQIVKVYLSQEESLKQKIKEHENKVQAYIEEQKRKEEMNTKLDFYRLKLSDSEMSDVIRLTEISSSINQPDVLKKLIYKTYFEKKMNDLLGRVVGSNSEISGIYKITHIESQKSYIGQTTNMKDRWRTHLKRGLGIDTPVTNKFYQSMIELKPWNFTWEVLEPCSKEELNEKEKYWIEFFQTNSWGWNSKGGNR